MLSSEKSNQKSMVPATATSPLDYGMLISKGILTRRDAEVIHLSVTRTEKPTPKQLAEILQMLIRDSGAKELPMEDVARIAMFISQRYGEFSLKEIKTAFEYLIVGEYESEIEHYGNFSMSYVGKVLNAFRTKRKEAKTIIKRALPEPEKVLSEDEIKVIQDNFLGTFDKVYSDFLSGKEVSHRVSWIYYEWLDTRKLITLTLKQKLKILSIAKKKVNEERQQLAILIRFKREDSNPEDNIKSLAKALAVIEQFKKYQHNGVSRISDLLREKALTQV